MFMKLLHLSSWRLFSPSSLHFQTQQPRTEQTAHQEEVEGRRRDGRHRMLEWKSCKKNTTILPLLAKTRCSIKRPQKGGGGGGGRAERERKTVLIDSRGVNPLAVAHGEGKESHKGQRSVTGKRWSEGGEDTETEKGSFERTAVVLETQWKLWLGGFTEDISLFQDGCKDCEWREKQNQTFQSVHHQQLLN